MHTFGLCSYNKSRWQCWIMDWRDMEIQEGMKFSSDQIFILTILYIFHTISDDSGNQVSLWTPSALMRSKYMRSTHEQESQISFTLDLSPVGSNFCGELFILWISVKVFDESQCIVCFRAFVGRSCITVTHMSVRSFRTRRSVVLHP